MLGQPKDYPHELTQALARFFKTKKQVKRAWLAHFHNPDDGLPPHTLIGIEAPEGFDEVSAEVGIVVQQIKVPNPPIDIMPITGQGGVDGYFLNGQKPFYTKSLFGLF